MIELLTDVDEDTNGLLVIPTSYPMIIAVWGDDFGSGTVNLEASPDGGTTWIPITRHGTALTYTVNKIEQIGGLIAVGMAVRATLTGSTSPDGVHAWLYENVL